MVMGTQLNCSNEPISFGQALSMSAGEMSICSKLRPDLSEMEFRIFVRIQKVIWDHLLASKAEIIQIKAFYNLNVTKATN